MVKLDEKVFREGSLKEIYILEKMLYTTRGEMTRLKRYRMQILTGKERRENGSFQRNLLKSPVEKKTMGPCQAIQLLVGNGFCSSGAHFLFRVNISETIF